MDGNEVRAWRPQHVLRAIEHLCTHRYVLLLHGRGHGPRVPKVHLVEEAFDDHANGKNSCEKKKSNKILKTCFKDNVSFHLSIIILERHLTRDFTVYTLSLVCEY